MTATRSTRPPVGRVAVYVISLVALIALSLGIAPALPASAATCDYAGSLCSGGSAAGGSATIWATQTSAGTSAAGSSGASASTSKATSSSKVSSSATSKNGMCVVGKNIVIICARLPVTAVSRATASSPAAIPSLTLRDLAAFQPQPLTLQTEPSRWTVLGAETNLYVGTSQHSVTGTLLGRSIEVRFTPVDFNWNYGDGTSAAGGQAGASWRALGLPEFSHTATSHIYTQLGSFQPSVTVGFQVEYRWANLGWIMVSGRVQSSAGADILLVVPAHTVLMTGPCQPGSSAPGC